MLGDWVKPGRPFRHLGHPYLRQAHHGLERAQQKKCLALEIEMPMQRKRICGEIGPKQYCAVIVENISVLRCTPFAPLLSSCLTTPSVS